MKREINILNQIVNSNCNYMRSPQAMQWSLTLRFQRARRGTLKASWLNELLRKTYQHQDKETTAGKISPLPFQHP